MEEQKQEWEQKQEYENIKEQICPLLEHLKIRPTYLVLNIIHIILKNKGYKDIPKIKYIDKNIITLENINNYCEDVMRILKDDPIKEEIKKKNYTKEVHIYKEATLLPRNIYISEKKEEDKIEEDYTDNDITSESESENSLCSDIDKQEEGYEIYEDDDSEDFSE